MRQKKSFAPRGGACKRAAGLTESDAIPVAKPGVSPMAAVIAYTPPVIRENRAGCYIEFYAFDPERNRLRRKVVKLNHVKGTRTRRAYARELVMRLNRQLAAGWNPWIMRDLGEQVFFEEGLGRFEAHNAKMLASGYYRKETYAGYASYVNMLRTYIGERGGLTYVYQFDRKFCADFLDWVFIKRGCGAQTRNNYLNFLRVFSGFLVEKGFLKSRPTEGIKPIEKRLYMKERECIPTDVVGRIGAWCRANDPDFFFACLLLYYCFVRPVEMTRIKVGDFSLKNRTLTVSAADSKNHRTQVVTVPRQVFAFGVERGVFSAPLGHLVFSVGLRPGTESVDPKIFRDHWAKVRKALRLRPEWKFYSLKDTGITELCRRGQASIAVRDQARHSSLAITEIYTGRADVANPELVEYEGSL